MSQGLEVLLVGLQAVVTGFLLFHDWIPLGRLNNLRAMRGEDSLAHRIWVTLLPGVPAALAFAGSIHFFGRRYPDGLEGLLWITYTILFLGILRAWWIPYLLRPDPERAARYKVIFAGTHTFLPRRNGLAPDTLHTCFHGACVGCLILLAMRDHLGATSP